jgi:hypothetical protein
MSKLKDSIITEQEQLDSRLYPVLANKDPRSSGLNVCGIDLSDEELATLDKEFNDWLDAYEASFGDNL